MSGTRAPRKSPRLRATIENSFNPERNGHRAQPSSLPLDIEQHPSFVAQLERPDFEADQFVAPQSAGDEHGQKRTIAQAEAGLCIGDPEQFARFSFGQPFSQPLSPLLHIRHPRKSFPLSQ